METILLFAPLVGAIIAGFGWKMIGEHAAQWVATGLLFLSALLSWIVFLTFDGTTEHVEILRWIQSGTLDTSWGIRMDRLTAIMLIVITTVSAWSTCIPSATWPMTRISRKASITRLASLLTCRSLPSPC